MTPDQTNDDSRPDTRLVHLGRQSAAGQRGETFVNPPLIRGSTVLHRDVDDMHERLRGAAAGERAQPVTYGIHGSSTHRDFLDLLTDLEGGEQSWAVPSGLSACTTAILALVQQGDHVLVPDSAYGPTRDFCERWLPRIGVQSTFYAPTMGPDVESLFRAETRVLFLESPGSLTFEVQDVPLLASLARQNGVASIIDNTWATPLYFQPLKHGVDISVHAATKYIAGHADVLLGTITAGAAMVEPLRQAVRMLGLYASPDDCWLALRGLRSLAARLPVHRRNAEAMIRWLAEQPEVARVLYPALPEDPGYDIWRRDFSGATGLFGVQLHPGVKQDAFHALINDTRLFGRGYSWGGFESLMIPSYPRRDLQGVSDRGPLLRISAGLEAAEDLVADLQAGFQRMRAKMRSVSS